MPSLFELDYFFWVVALGTMSLGFLSGVLGTTVVLERQSQLGDTIGHAVYPGVILAFMVFQTRDNLILYLGAILIGLLCYWLIVFIQDHSNFAFESILALILSSMFSLGLLLYQVVQRYPRFQTVNFAGLNNFIFGQAAFMTIPDVQLNVIVTVIALGIFIYYYPQIQVYLFDKVYAQSVGINTSRIKNLLLILTLACIVIGLQSVGAILISSMLVAPAIASRLWTKHYSVMVLLAGFLGLASAFIGTYLSTYIENLASGPTIVVVQSLIALFSILFAPGGVLGRRLREGRVSA